MQITQMRRIYVCPQGLSAMLKSAWQTVELSTARAAFSRARLLNHLYRNWLDCVIILNHMYIDIFKSYINSHCHEPVHWSQGINHQWVTLSWSLVWLPGVLMGFSVLFSGRCRKRGCSFISINVCVVCIGFRTIKTTRALAQQFIPYSDFVSVPVIYFPPWPKSEEKVNCLRSNLMLSAICNFCRKAFPPMETWP